MSRFLIKQIKYIGAKYYYESPILKSGINILEGENGSGKTTFTSLIYFCLGGNVKWFKKDNDSDHREIVDDESNYAELTFLIKDETYLATRYFYKNEINIVSKDDVLTLPINRSKDKNYTFSDWFLEKMNIRVVDIYQGSEYYKINLYDLMRLFYYDQNTATDKVYKRPDNENFITDSLIIRKAIFEILMGNSFGEYYEAIAEYRKSLSEQAVLKSVIENFKILNIDSQNLFEGKNTYSLKEDLEEIEDQLRRLRAYRETIKGNVSSKISDSDYITGKRNEYSRIEGGEIEHRNKRKSLYEDYSRVTRLRATLILEVTQLKKIMITNEHLNLFSPNTCPYCLQKAERSKNRCICGNEVSDEQYQKFFYSKEEYFNILKSKQKNIQTVESAINTYKTELNELDERIALFNKRLTELKSEISQLIKGKQIETNVELKEVNDKIFDLEKKLGILNQQIVVENKREELEFKLSQLSITLEDKKRLMKKLEIESQESMDSIIKEFNRKYWSLMEVALEGSKSARISPDNYLPIINSGSYTEASSEVPKRMMYFFTLLHLSLTNNIKFPKFLIIDTPENIGIDDDKLIKNISLINDIGTENSSKEDFQIILTTGENKYPEAYEKFVFQKISKKNRLLQKRTIDSFS